ncbi:Aste57867_2650 [Aphanomyces stellatus]|uniref:Aste57867_2650 protein n=1 Tax=Aphanomyces stellatus TaxID=120398 RepID=A0A485KD80_9STRA|nr:hypothetical protein As57867_002643 [Aphanomyces stellatus]VFT79844.1 Aste57867_2650 [Aphanomyces stellatus]
MVEHVTAQVAYSSLTDGSIGLYPAPQSWRVMARCTRGGRGLKPFLSFRTECSESYKYIVVTPIRQTIVVAVLLAGLTNATTDQMHVICTEDEGYYGVCMEYLGDVEWVFSIRKGIRFEGDHGTLAVLTEPLQHLKQEVNLAEFPSSVAYYMRGAVTNVTGIMITLFAASLLYALLSRGYVEVLNLLKLQRVGAIVWIGRPLLFVRSLTAVGVLATATVHLDTTGSMSWFTEPLNPFYTTLLSANEVSWIVAVVNDIAISVTNNYKSYYSTTNNMLVWGLTVALSYAFSIQHTVEIQKQWHIVQVDFQIECTSGVVIMGQPARLTTLVCLAVRPTLEHSKFLYAGAKYLFNKSGWVHNDVYNMDRMSGLLNGLVTVHREKVIYGLDVKLWHMFRLDKEPDPTLTVSNSLFQSSEYAIPLPLCSC